MHFAIISALFLSSLLCGVFSIHVTVPELIRMHGYPCEEHFVITEDGYILAMHRIPHGKYGKNKRHARQPVIMQHGLFSSSASWALNIKSHESPAYLIADAGYDVWLTNIRGSVYSKNHTRLHSDEKEFWNFSWDEMAKYDLPKFIDYILGHTGYKRLNYIGHSMGTTIFFAGLSIKPEYNSKIGDMIALAPVGTVSHIETWFKYMARFQNIIKGLLELIGDYEVIPDGSSALMEFVREVCTWTSISEKVCKNFFFMVVGFDDSEFDDKWMEAINDELLCGTSINTLLHYTQEYESGRFQHFDYGEDKNEEKYGQIAPPEYDISKVTARVHLLWGMNDFLADDKDVQFLIKELPNVRSKFPVPYKKFNHLDFLWAKDLKTLVYDPVLKMMSGYRIQYDNAY